MRRLLLHTSHVVTCLIVRIIDGQAPRLMLLSRCLQALMCFHLIWLLLMTCMRSSSALTCQTGDIPCFCKNELGGNYKVMPHPMLSACQRNYTHQGLNRYVHVYLPPSYDGKTAYPLWVHLHGVFWATMDNISQKVGHPVNATDIIPTWDKTIDLFGRQAIIVYPQSSGDAGTGNLTAEGQGNKYRQFWHVPFWRCSVGICRPPGLDDVGFVEQVLQDLPTRLSVAPGKYYLSGESAGGMMVEALLCQSKILTNTITAAADILGGLGADYALSPACASSAPEVPYLHLQGVNDPTLAYNKSILVDGVRFLSAIDNARLLARRSGCLPADAGPAKPKAAGNMLCKDYCARHGGKHEVEICGIVGVAHDTNHPYTGFVYQQAWQFFQQQSQAAAATPAPRSQNPAASLMVSPTGGLGKRHLV